MSDADRVRVRVLRPEEWAVWKRLRLEALQESPDAFGEILENAQQRPDSGWHSVAASASLPDRRNFLAEYDGHPVGMALVRRAPDDASRGNLYAMWVSPATRGRGVGRALLDAAVAWARAAGIEALSLHVTEGNRAARELYLRSGFRATGEREPLRPGASIHTERMVLRVER